MVRLGAEGDLRWEGGHCTAEVVHYCGMEVDDHRERVWDVSSRPSCSGSAAHLDHKNADTRLTRGGLQTSVLAWPLADDHSIAPGPRRMVLDDRSVCPAGVRALGAAGLLVAGAVARTTVHSHCPCGSDHAGYVATVEIVVNRLRSAHGLSKSRDYFCCAPWQAFPPWTSHCFSTHHWSSY